MAVQLPGGAWHHRERIRDVRLRPLTGYDEEWLLANAARPPATVATELLARCVVRLGTSRPDVSVLDGLTVGDREVLFWHLRAAAFGDRVDAVVECGSCGEKLDLSLELTDLIGEVHEGWSHTYTDEVAGRRVTYRLPTGADQKAGVAGGLDDAPLHLLERCVAAIDDGPPEPHVLADIAEAIGDAMLQRDPQAETRLEATCPDCGAGIDVLLDAFSFLREETVQRARFLFDEVHTLAWHYHWTESDILSMTAARRRLYLDLVAGAYEGGAI